MAEKKGYPHPHGGHRGRLKERFRKEGLQNFQEHEILELLLFYSIPQKDTNELAHSLIKRFNGLKHVLDADYASLLECSGISEHSATLIKLVRQLEEWNNRKKLNVELNCADSDAVGRYFVEWFRGKQKESLVAIFVDAGGFKIGDAVELIQGSLDHVMVPNDRIIEEIGIRHASAFILAHNHPNRIPYASKTDLDVTKHLYRIFTDLGKPLKEHYLIAEDRFYPLVTYLQDHLRLQ